MEPLVNVVVVGRDLWEMTCKCIEGLIFTMNVPWHLIFVDNGSTDETRRVFKEIAPTWKWQYFTGYSTVLYPKGRSVALSVAWNRAYEKAPKGAEYTLFANNDIVFHQFGWWDKFQELLDQDVALAGLQEMTWYRFRFIEGSLFAATNGTFDLLAAQEGGNLFDPRFKLTCEDVDLSERALRLGMNIGQVHELQTDWLVHIGHQTIQHFGQQGEDMHTKMHTARKLLCKKYDYEEQIVD